MEANTNNTDEYITIDEASKLTKNSIPTIRCFMLADKDLGSDIIKVDITTETVPVQD
jgi:hypothetical protein